MATQSVLSDPLPEQHKALLRDLFRHEAQFLYSQALMERHQQLLRQLSQEDDEVAIRKLQGEIRGIEWVANLKTLLLPKDPHIPNRGGYR